MGYIMQKLIIHGRQPLFGEITVSGAKNATLPLMFATLLTKGEFHISNIPRLRDVQTTVDLLKQLGTEVSFEDHSLKIWTDDLQKSEAPYDLVRTMRASILCLGPLLARAGRARVSLPGGCAIGARPINIHLDAMAKLGAKISLEGGYVDAKVDRLVGGEIKLELPSVTGTENVMMLATAAEGTTILRNAAREPEVVELQNFLNAMGAKIQGAETGTITIQGRTPLHSTSHSVMPDRIEAGTFFMACAAAGGELFLKHAKREHLESVIQKLQECGVEFEFHPDGIRVKHIGKLCAVDVQTAPYPGFPTDCQAQMMAMLTTARGTSTIVEQVFENRYMHVQELQRMGADIRLKGNTTVIRGIEKPLSGAPVMATDLRASASLIIAGLMAEGTTIINRIYHLDRGYEQIEKKLQQVGAKISRE